MEEIRILRISILHFLPQKPKKHHKNLHLQTLHPTHTEHNPFLLPLQNHKQNLLHYHQQHSIPQTKHQLPDFLTEKYIKK